MILAVNQLLLIFKTNINTQEKVNHVSTLLNSNPLIIDWSVDLLDVDCVLRIEAIEGLTVEETQDRLLQDGYVLELLDN